ncbi:MAG: ShlB/FhaC/HecB family hemolysin secretion/activation protein [Rhodoferax sp.]|nr:ShlB/FhaC/HecB family hemolysin secretion/activation protein [Rhodoferax sp.]
MFQAFSLKSVEIRRRKARVLCILVALSGGALGAMAQGPLNQGLPANPAFVIRGFDITGDNPLPQDETTRILAPFLRTNATIDTLQQATAALESALKGRGYGLHRVALPPQEVGAKVTLNVVKFVIGKVTVEGLSRLSESNVRASVPELVEGAAPNLQTLALQAALANENEGKKIQVSLKESEEADKIDVKIVVKEERPWSVSASLSNTGSDSTGKHRLTLVGGHSNLFDKDHQLTAAYTTSPERMRDVRQWGLNYRIPLYRQGAVFGLSTTRSNVIGNFGAFSSTGAGQTVGLNYSHYFAPVGGRRSYLTASVDDKRFDAGQINGIEVPGQLMRRSRPISMGYSTRIESDTAVWAYNVDLAANLQGGAGNNLLVYQTEDGRVSTARWKAVRGGGSYLGSLGSGWLWGVRGQFQYSPDALISGEQFGLGGAASVRGTGERPIAGDSGLQTSAELSSPELHIGLRVLGFFDAGWLANNNDNGNPKPGSDSLASVGLGLRYVAGAYGVTADWARIVRGSVLPFAAGSGLPQAGDQKVHFNFSARF